MGDIKRVKGGFEIKQTIDPLTGKPYAKAHDFVRDTDVFKALKAISEKHGYSCDEAARTGLHAVMVYCNDKGINFQNALVDAKARVCK